MTNTRTRSVAPRVLAVAAAYGVAVCLLTWPLATHLSTHRPEIVPGLDYDALYSAWVLAWQTGCVAGRVPHCADANIYYPSTDTLFYGPLALGALPYFAPLYLLGGNPLLALNLVFLGSLTFGASAWHLVVRAWTGWHTAGMVAATALLLNRWLLLTFVPATPHMAVLFYLPLIVFLAAPPTLPWRRGALLLAAVVLQCLTDLVYIAPAVLAPLAMAGLLALRRPATRARGLRLLLVVGITIALLAPIYAHYLSVATRNPDLLEQTHWRLSAAQMRLTLPGGLLGILSPLAVPSLSIALALSGVALSAGRRWRGSAVEADAICHALVWVVVGIAISLPAEVVVADTTYRLPLAYLERWGLAAGALRLPERLRVAALAGITALVGLTVAELARRVGIAGSGRRDGVLRAACAAGFAALLFAQYQFAVGQPSVYGPRLPMRYPLVEAPRTDTPALRRLSEMRGPTLELPIPRAASHPHVAAGAQAAAMYRSIFHGQPLLNGYGSYWPSEFAARMRLAARLPDSAALQALRRETGLAFVLVRARALQPADAWLESERAAWLDLARSGGRPDLVLIAQDPDFLLFRVSEEPPANGDATAAPPPRTP